MEDQKSPDDTFLNFGEGQKIAGEGEMNINLAETVNKVADAIEEILDVSNKSFKEILESCHIDTLVNEELTPNFSAVLYKNRYFKLYLGKHTNLGACSIIVLNGINKNKSEFADLLGKLSQIKGANTNKALKLYGVCLFDDKAYLVFEPILSSLSKKIKEKGIDDNGKYAAMFYLIELTMQLHEKNIQLHDIKEDTILYTNTDEFRFLVPYKNFLKFNQNHENANEKLEEMPKFNRYSPPESVNDNPTSGIENDIWAIGCLFVEIFSAQQVWAGIKENDIVNDLKKFYVPKIHKDIPKNAWSVICECLNPFKETRISAKELLEKYVLICKKIKLVEVAKDIEKYISMDGLAINQTMIEDGVDPKAIRKCPIHPKYEAFTFCAQCNEIICDMCKKTIHAEHADKGVFFEYLDFINIARSRIHAYKEKFQKYVEACNIPKKEVYEVFVNENEGVVDKLYEVQKAKIEEQFAYLIKLIEEMRQLELDFLLKYKEFFKGLYGKVNDNYKGLILEIESGNFLKNNLVESTIAEKEDHFLKFQDLDQLKKEEVMKSITKDENMLSFKKKNIIKFVTNFHKESSQVERIKRYFETLVEKYKENKINDLVKVVEKKNASIRSKYESLDLTEYLKVLISEFEQTSLHSSRNYFNSNSRELFISIVNTNKIFTYNIDLQRYEQISVDFTDMPTDRFPNFSRSVIVSGNLLVNGGYDEEGRVTLPYFFHYDRLNKRLNKLADMLYGHSAHSIIWVPPRFVIVVSGSGITKCEQYDFDNNSWTELPEISVPRQNCTLYFFDKQYLYAFGGAFWDEQKKTFIYLETVERLNLGFGSLGCAPKWDVLNTHQAGGGNWNIKKSVMSVLSYTAGKILMVGGSVNYNTYSDECFVFDFDKNEFSKKDGLLLPRKTCFPSKCFMYSGDKAYQLDNDGNVYEFDFVLDKFSIIAENKKK